MGCFAGKELSFIAFDAAWSPGGQWIAVAATDQIVFHQVVGGDETIVWPARARARLARERAGAALRAAAQVDPRDLRIVVGGLVGELRVHVHRVVVDPEARQQVVADEDLVEDLRVALEDVGVALGLRKSCISDVRTPPSRMSTVSENSKSLMSPRTITLAAGRPRGCRRRSRSRPVPARAEPPRSNAAAAGSARRAGRRRPWS